LLLLIILHGGVNSFKAFLKEWLELFEGKGRETVNREHHFDHTQVFTLQFVSNPN